MRLLIACHSRLDPRFGAAQIALELAEALRRRGHDVTTWSPWPLPGKPRGLAAIRSQSSALADFLGGGPPFDVIDLPGVSLSKDVAAFGSTVSRSVQPEVGYLAAEVRNAWRTRSPWLGAHLLRLAYVRALVHGGWQRASRILCLGTIEHRTMHQRFPRWRSKLAHYVCATPAKDREQLLVLRAERRTAEDPERRILWIGRWAAQKGTGALIGIVRSLLAESAVQFTIAGAGSAPAAALPRDVLASGRVRIVEHFDRAELPALLREHQLGLFTSSVEGWGVSLSEMLESGLTVFATEAGAVADLRPYFPRTLRPVSEASTLAVQVPEDLQASGYLETFNWDAIAHRYERDILLPLQGGSGR